MGMTISEKILARASGRPEVRAGEIVWAKVDKAMMDDVLGPRLEIDDCLREMGVDVWDPDKVVIISDHYTPPANLHQANIVKFTREWAKEHGISRYYEFAGPCHQVMVEHGHVLPGSVVVGTDSHTCTYGALAAFATGVGSTEMAGVLATGQTWLKVPQTIRLRFDGALRDGVMAKDVVLRAIGTVGHNGATYKAMEFCGTTFRSMIMDERLCVANMAVEAGAKNGLVPYDDVTRAYLEELGVEGGWPCESSDPDAVFCAGLPLRPGSWRPRWPAPTRWTTCAKPRSRAGYRFIRHIIGSCTGGRYHDLKMAAELLRGRKIAPGLRLLVSPASREIYNQCLREGILEVLAEAGATVLASSCGACLGVHSGTIGAGEVCVSATNRNFIGRMGSKQGQRLSGSPVTVAASALTGHITDPREI